MDQDSRHDESGITLSISAGKPSQMIEIYEGICERIDRRLVSTKTKSASIFGIGTPQVIEIAISVGAIGGSMVLRDLIRAWVNNRKLKIKVTVTKKDLHKEVEVTSSNFSESWGQIEKILGGDQN